MRLFTAIDISPDVKDNLRVLLDRLRPLARLSWSPVDNLHVTTKFIGEWPLERLEEMKRTLARVPISGPIDITIRGLGWFPNPKNPRVFWAGVHGGEALAGLAAATEAVAAKAGVPEEPRAFSPHLTLARIRERVSLAALHKAIAGLSSDDFGTFHAEAFFLYQSAGGKYTKLAEFSL
jgi:RNA 2',3'-cyclic 3'-phosphodiesterase